MPVATVAGPGARGVRLAALPPLSLYVHMPWCARKCPYCDFNSHEARSGVPEDAYVAALIGDLESSLPEIWGRRVHSIFFGGGTPSLFSADAIDTLLSAARARLPLAADCEVTLEANPGTLEAGKFRDFRAAGVNRLSIGVQSFDSRHLQALGRIHDAIQARRAVERALEHFDNVNLDLMYALPGQTPDDLQADVNAALSFATPHLSFYHLTIEPHTLFHRYPPQVPDDDAAAEMQEAIEAALGAAGYAHYETSAWARPGRECLHNLNYWRFGDYLGIGAGAHSKLSFPGRIVRQVRAKQPLDYLQRAEAGTPSSQEHEVGFRDLPFEFMMNSLRLAQGFEIALYAERTGLAITSAEKPLALAEARGLIGRDAIRIWPTELGRRFLNDLLQLFLPEEK
jgi:oxygen-independent coproporphyrinogen-3 oxidase